MRPSHANEQPQHAAPDSVSIHAATNDISVYFDAHRFSDAFEGSDRDECANRGPECCTSHSRPYTKPYHAGFCGVDSVCVADRCCRGRVSSCCCCRLSVSLSTNHHRLREREKESYHTQLVPIT